MQPKRVRKGDTSPAAKGNCRGVFRSADVRTVLLTETRVRGAGRIGVLTGLPPKASRLRDGRDNTSAAEPILNFAKVA
ncbi:hypothetical protein B4135_2504 [Caldibacillus debilis]|uniref:Uncharacterized protein n=1 Tax=Caldibacillus debilis TaxID=301148 RepID=A0A150LZV1_9BACI|nr:hypothetical protein B4135_2504 [Caldibacillus debilis]